MRVRFSTVVSKRRSIVCALSVLPKGFSMATECEAKLRVDSLDAVRGRLRMLGAVDRGEAFERNWVFDREGGELFREGTLLRVRNAGGEGGILTVKRKTSCGSFKNREEVESVVDSAETLVRQLEMTGFHVSGRYEKFRETWLWGDAVVSLDECPEIGCFVEIEGTTETIRRVAADLCLDPEKHLDGSYLELWRTHLLEKGENGMRDMTFAENDPAFTRHGAPKRSNITYNVK